MAPATAPLLLAGEQQDPKKEEDEVWQQLAFPFYMQSASLSSDPCKDLDTALGQATGTHSDDERPACVWQAIRSEAERDAAEEPLLSSFLYASILAHDSFERALAFVLSNRLASAVMLPTQLFEIFHEVLTSDPDVRGGSLADVEACRDRDPACRSYSQALLYYKGYHALQTHRIAHALWTRGQRVMAVALQSRVSEVLAVDIHPAARLGRGILLDHGTGVVIGETAVIGNNVSLLQNVTLGGTGKEVGDRHPKISDNVLIGASATVLGNIVVGRGAQIAAGSLVLKPVPPHTMVAGSPAKPVGKLFGNPARDMQQWSRKFNDYDPAGGQERGEEAAGSGAGAAAGQRGGSEGSGSSGSSSGRSLQPAGAPISGAGADVPAAAALSGSGWAAAPAGAGSSGGASAPSGDWLAAPANGSAYRQGAATNGVAHTRTHVSLNHASGPAAGAAGAQQGESSMDERPAPGPAPLGGVYEGDVDATMDEEAAAVLWPRREDPEYVI
ncbi:MAG: trimeric LpxA-like protein [Monoraphidium minutum]|nr:MAG: trimeric LpxA-like protein [Monoraphidium minutum]